MTVSCVVADLVKREKWIWKLRPGTLRRQALHQPVCVCVCVCVCMEGHLLRPSCADQAKFQAGGVWTQAQQAGFRESVRKSSPRSAPSE